MIGIKTLPVQAAYRQPAADALLDAFSGDPLFAFTIPNERQRIRWMRHLMAEVVRHEMHSEWSRVAVADDGGVSAVLLAGTYPPSIFSQIRLNIRMGLFPTPWEPSFRRFMPMFTYMKLWEQMHYKGDHIYVYMIGARRAFQGKGIGRTMMGELVEAVHDRGLPVYLETQTERNVPFYKSLGFTLTEEHHPFADGPPTWGFLNAPG